MADTATKPKPAAPKPAAPAKTKTTTVKPPAVPKPAKRAAMTGRSAGKASLGAAPAAAAGELLLTDIDPTHWSNPRGDIDQKSDSFRQLVDSIKALGVHTPVLVGPALVEGGKHPLIAGWRRYTASGVAGKKSIPVHQVALADAKDTLVAAIAENVARDAMDPLAEATAIYMLMSEHGYTQVQAGKEIGMSERTVRERLRLLKINELVPAAGQAISSGQIPMDAAVQLQLVAETAPAVADELVQQVKTGGVRASALTSSSGLADALERVENDEAARERGVWAIDIDAQHPGTDLPLTAEQLTRWQAIPPEDSWRTQPPYFEFDEPDAEAARAAGCLLEVTGTDRWGQTQTLRFITDRDLLAARATLLLDQMEADGRERAEQEKQRKAQQAAATGKAGAKNLTAEQRSEAQKVKDKAAAAKELAHHKNVVLGERLAHGLDGAAGSLEAAKILALIALDDAAGVVAAGAKYCDPAYLTEEVRKNGTVKRTYDIGGGGGASAEQAAREAILAADTVPAAIAPLLRLLAMARHADDQVVAESSRAYWRMRGTYSGRAYGVPAMLDQLVKDAGILEDLTAEAKRRAAKTTSTAAAKPATSPVPPSKRSAEALRHVTAQPGITIPELAQKMGIAQNYLYRVLPELQKDGHVRKEGRGWHPAATESEAGS